MSLFDLIAQNADKKTILEFIRLNPTDPTELHPQQQTPGLFELLNKIDITRMSKVQEKFLNQLVLLTITFIKNNQTNPNKYFAVVANSICLVRYFIQLCGSCRGDHVFKYDQSFNSADMYWTLSQQMVAKFALTTEQHSVLERMFGNLLQAKIETGDSLLEQNKFELALTFYEQALDQTPTHYPAKIQDRLLARIVSCFEQCQNFRAITNFRNTNLIDKAKIYQQLGKGAIENQNLLAASKYYEVAAICYDLANLPEMKQKCTLKANEYHYGAIRQEQRNENLSCPQLLHSSSTPTESRTRLVMSK